MTVSHRCSGTELAAKVGALVLAFAASASTSCSRAPLNDAHAVVANDTCVELTYTEISLTRSRAITPQDLERRWDALGPDLTIRTCCPAVVERLESVLASEAFEDYPTAHPVDVRARVVFFVQGEEHRRLYLATTGVAVEGGRTRLHRAGAGVHGLLLRAVEPLMVLTSPE